MSENANIIPNSDMILGMDTTFTRHDMSLPAVLAEHVEATTRATQELSEAPRHTGMGLNHRQSAGLEDTILVGWWHLPDRVEHQVILPSLVPPISTSGGHQEAEVDLVTTCLLAADPGTHQMPS